MSFRLNGLILIALLTFGLAAHATACSLAPETDVPDNFDLVAESDAIVVARAVSGDRDPRGFNSTVTFALEKALKGQAPDKLELEGLYLGAATPSDPLVLDQANEDAYSGGCIRRVFRVGDRYVLFLRRNADGRWGINGQPFSRVSEDYTGDDSLWVQVIRTYLDIQRDSDDPARMKALADLAQRKLTEPVSAARDAWVRDLIVHLGSYSQRRSTARLLSGYAALERGQDLLPTALAEAGISQATVDSMFTGERRLFPPPPIREQQAYVLVNLVNGDHPDAGSLFDRLTTDTELPRGLGLAIRFFAKNGAYRKAYDLIEGPALRRLPALPPTDAAALLRDIASAQRGESYEEGKERWRSDPYVASRWPELSLSLFWFNWTNSEFGGEGWGSDDFNDLRPADFRARPELTLAMANDEVVTRWAVAELSDEAKRQAYEALPDQERFETLDPATLPMQVLVLGYSEERSRLLEASFCKGGTRRALLYDVLAQLGGLLSEEFVANLAASPGLTEDDRQAIGMIMVRMQSRGGQDPRGGVGRMYLGGGSFDYEKLVKFIRGEPNPEAKPIICLAT